MSSPAVGPRRDPQSQPGATRYQPPARPEGVAAPTPATPSGPFCWQCDWFAVDAEGDLCDLCLDAVAADLAERFIGSGW